jgi:RimJ/RimL family protein N-acetyltransferase
MLDMNDTTDRLIPRPDPRPVDRAWHEMSWPVAPATELTGTWIKVTPTTPDTEASELFRALDDKRVWAHIPTVPTDANQLTVTLRNRDADPAQQSWTLRLQRPLAGHSIGTIVGMSCYLDVSVHDARLEIGSTLYRPSVWGTAVNPEAKLLLLGHAFDKLGVGRAQLQTDIRNVRSQRAIAKLGATYEGTLRRHKRRPDGTVRDSVLFSITAEEWPGVRKRLTERIAGF